MGGGGSKQRVCCGGTVTARRRIRTAVARGVMCASAEAHARRVPHEGGENGEEAEAVQGCERVVAKSWIQGARV
jgi:hypothetical protein